LLLNIFIPVNLVLSKWILFKITRLIFLLSLRKQINLLKNTIKSHKFSKIHWDCSKNYLDYLVLLFVELVNDDSDQEVESEEAAEDNERHEVEVHVDVHLTMRLKQILSYFTIVNKTLQSNCWRLSKSTMFHLHFLNLPRFIFNKCQNVTWLFISTESMASFMMSVQPFHVAT
jgi:hypothetical protein